MAEVGGVRLRHLFRVCLLSSSYAPGNPDETIFINEVVKPLSGESKALLPKLRHLLFESHTFLTAELQATVERKDGDKPTKTSQAEREARKQGVQPHMTGLNTDHEHDAAHCLVDLCTQIYNDEVLRLSLGWSAQHDIRSEQAASLRRNGVLTPVGT